MAESFENLDNILRDWAKDKGQKRLAETLNRFEKQEEEEIKPFLLKNNPEKVLEQSQSTVEKHCYISNLTNSISKMFLRSIYLKIKLFPVSE